MSYLESMSSEFVFGSFLIHHMLFVRNKASAILRIIN